MIESIRFRLALPFNETTKEEFITIIWNDVTDRWGADFTPEIGARIQMELDTFEQVEGYMEYLYFVWRVVYDSGYYIMPYRTLAHVSAQWQEGYSSRTELLAHLLGAYGKGDRERTLQ
ncbi:MAG: hypothetical protein IIX13_08725 [Bacteroidales bacterium]|nr:hypothetical protein [Bacteroidales bacterium]